MISIKLRKSLVVLATVVFIAVGCQQGEETIVVPTETNIPKKAFSATPTLRPAFTFTSTLTNIPRTKPTPHEDLTKSPIKVPSPLCSQPTDFSDFDIIQNYDSYIGAIGRNLNSCVPPIFVATWLQASERFWGFAEDVDLNKDGIVELIIAGVVEFPMYQRGEPPWMIHILVFFFDGNRYTYQVMFWSGLNGGPEFFSQIDINSDGIEEVIFITPHGGNWCEMMITAVGWRYGEPVDYFENVRDFVDCRGGANTHIRDLNGDGLLEFIQCRIKVDCENSTPSGSIVYWLRDSYYEAEDIP